MKRVFDCRHVVVEVIEFVGGSVRFDDTFENTPRDVDGIVDATDAIVDRSEVEV